MKKSVSARVSSGLAMVSMAVAVSILVGCGEPTDPYVLDPWDNIFRVDACFGDEKVFLSVRGDFPDGNEPGEKEIRPGDEVSYRVSDGEEYRVTIYDQAGATLQDTVVEGGGYPVDCPDFADCTKKHIIKCR